LHITFHRFLDRKRLATSQLELSLLLSTAQDSGNCGY
jgi:hypothetical protein